MKYVITDHNKIAIGSGTYHQDLLHAISGNITGAGHFTIKRGKVEVFGESVAYGLQAKPEDAEIISQHLGL